MRLFGGPSVVKQIATKLAIVGIGAAATWGVAREGGVLDMYNDHLKDVETEEDLKAREAELGKMLFVADPAVSIEDVRRQMADLACDYKMAEGDHTIDRTFTGYRAEVCAGVEAIMVFEERPELQALYDQYAYRSSPEGLRISNTY